MNRNSFFLVIEGLDGSGKTELSRRLAENLRVQYKGAVEVLWTFEPNDPSGAGLFIREILERQIENSSLNLLARFFAANRLDHYERLIKPFLAEANEDSKRVVICDRYYLSSLVYQSSVQEDLSIPKIMAFNDSVPAPDLTLFFDVEDKNAHKRIKKRAKTQERFEENLHTARSKYYEAIEFLTSRGEQIVFVEANGSRTEVYNLVCEAIHQSGPAWLSPQQKLFEFEPDAEDVFALNGKVKFSITEVVQRYIEKYLWISASADDIGQEDFEKIRNEITEDIAANLSFDEVGSVIFELLDLTGVDRGKRFGNWSTHSYPLAVSIPPFGLEMKGVLTLLDNSRLDYFDVIRDALKHDRETIMSQFMLVFLPKRSNHLTRTSLQEYQARERIHKVIRLLTYDDIADHLFLNVLSGVLQHNIYSPTRAKLSMSIRDYLSAEELSLKTFGLANT